MEEARRSSVLAVRAAAAFRAVVADPEAAAPDVARLVDEAGASDDPGALAAALRAAGWLERCRLHHEEAERILDRAVRVARANGLVREWREALTSRGAVRHERGRIVAAQRDFVQAAALAGEEVDLELDAERAALLQNTGRLGEAAAVYQRILVQPDAAADVRTKAANNLGLVEVWCGRPIAGLAWFDVAAQSAVEVGPAAEAFVLASRAWATVRAGDLATGLTLYDDAVDAWARLGIPVAELYAEYADALADLRLIPEAQREAERAVAALDEHGFALIAAEAELRCARLTLLRGDATAAAERAARAAERLRGHRRVAWAGQARLVGIEARLAAGPIAAKDLADANRAAATLVGAGFAAEAVDAYLAAGRVALALRRDRAAVDAFGRADRLAARAPLLTRLKGHLAGALAAATAGRTDAVIRRARAGLVDLASHRAALPSTELRMLASGHGAELGRVGLSAVARHRRAADVLAWMERTRAAALGSVDAPDVGGIDEELGALRVVQSELSAARREGSLGIDALLARQASIEDRIRRAAWRERSSAGDAGRPWSTGALRSVLDDQVLVEYDVLDGVVIAVAVERQRTRLVELGPITALRRELADLRFALRRLVSVVGSPASREAAMASATAALDALAGLLVAPLRIAPTSGVVVVPVGELQRVPWTALHDVPVAVAPSAALWARTRTRPSGGREHVLLVAGPELPGAVEEVADLARVHTTAVALVPPASTAAAVISAMADATLVHVACHGSVRADNPIFSSLLVSDGSLTVHELERRSIAPRRIVLAACESSSDTTYPGNESLGFVSTLLAGGTSGVIASSVVVPDWDIVALMTDLHRSLRAGSTMAVALHDAARTAIDRSDPAGFVSWCAFDAFGAA